MTHAQLTFILVLIGLSSCFASPQAPAANRSRTECEQIARRLSEAFADVFRFADDVVNNKITPAEYARATDRYVVYPLNITFAGFSQLYDNGTEVTKFLRAEFDFEFTIFTHRGLGDICSENYVSAVATARPDVRNRSSREYFAFGGYVDLFGVRVGNGDEFRVYKYIEVITEAIPLAAVRSHSSQDDPDEKEGKNRKKGKGKGDGFVSQTSSGQHLDLTPFYVVLSMMVGVILVLICGMCYMTHQFLRLKNATTPTLALKLGDGGSGNRVPRVERLRSGSVSDMI